MASSNGYDVSSLHWIGGLTYAEVFLDLAQRYYPGFVAQTGARVERPTPGVTRLAFANLSRDCCYTIGFRHHNFHPMLADPERMWQIQHAILTDMTPRVVQRGGLPAVPDQNIRTDELKEKAGGVLTFASLHGLGTDAYETALKLIEGLAGAEKASNGFGPAAAIGALNYGYILRSRSPERTRENSDLLIESPLLARIRKLAYERAPRSIRDKLKADERLEHNALRAYLTANERHAFLALFPNWAPKFQVYEEFVNNVVHLVVHAMRQRAMAPATREPAMRSTTGQVARALLDHIGRHESLTAFNRDTEGIVRDYVVNPEYAYLFLRAMRTMGPSSPAPGGAAPSGAAPSLAPSPAPSPPAGEPQNGAASAPTETPKA
jgi:hypothetical protein